MKSDNAVEDKSSDELLEDNDTNAELHSAIMKNIRNTLKHFSEWRENAKENYDFYSGKQWSDEDKAILRDQSRQAIVFNRTCRTINAIAGIEAQNRQEVIYYPREINDSQVTDLANDAAKWVRYSCDAEDEESESFLDLLICGHGWTHTRMDYSSDEDGMIIIERIDPLEVFPDHNSQKRNFDDSRYRFWVKSYSASEFLENFPGSEIPSSKFFDINDINTLEEDNSPGGYSPLVNKDISKDVSKQVQVALYQWFEIERYHLVQDLSGVTSEIKEDRFKELRSKFDEAGWQYTKSARPKKIYKQVFLTPTQIIGEPDILSCNAFTLNAITAFRNRNDKYWFSAIDLMKDPQMYANKWLSQITHILNTQAKAGKVAFESGAFKDPKKAKLEWAKPDCMLELNSGALAQNKFMIINGSGYPDGTDRLLQYAIAAVNDSVGVSMELIGLTGRDQAGVVEESRKQAGMTVLALLFDSLRRYRKEQGRVLLSYIREYISDGRLIRITNDSKYKYIPLLRDALSEKYDIVVDDSPTSPNMKEKVFNALKDIIPIALNTGTPVPPDILDYSPLPSDLVGSWKEFIKEKSNNPEAEVMSSLEKAMRESEIKEKISSAELNMARAKKELYEINSNNNAIKDKLLVAETAAKTKLSRDKLEIESALKREKNMSDASIKMMKHQLDSRVAMIKNANKGSL